MAHQENRHWFDKCTVGVSGTRPVGWLQFHCLRPSGMQALPAISFIASTTILREVLSPASLGEGAGKGNRNIHIADVGCQ